MKNRALFVPLAIVFASATLLTALPAAQQTVFRSTVDSVALDVAVTAGNRPVADLEAKDFEVTDNGAKQKILSISHDTMPIDVTFVIDTSDSAGWLLNSLIKGVETVRKKLRPDDRVAVVTFSQRIRERLSLVQPESASGLMIGPASGMTSLYDATVVALATPRIIDRRQMAILFTDGDDTMSFLDGSRVLDVAGHSSTAVFAVAMFGPWTLPDGFLQKIVDTTGGIVQIVPPWSGHGGFTTTANAIVQDGRIIPVDHSRTPGVEIDASFLRALEEFRMSYVVRYQVEGVPRTGWHDVSVRVTKSGHYTVRTRKGYGGG